LFFKKNCVQPHITGVSILALASALTATTVSAQDATISDDRTSSTTTTDEIGADAGTLTIDTDGSITVTTGTALTVNGPHDLVQTGSITSNDLAAGRGLFLDATTKQLLSDISIDGVINVAVPADTTDFEDDPSTSNIGVELGGTFGLVGDITLTDTGDINVWGGDSRGLLLSGTITGDITNDGSITVTGSRSIGIDLQADLIGDILNTGTVDARNPDSVAVNIAGALDGTLTNRGSILAGRAATTDDDSNTVDAIPGLAAILVENNITGGILLDGIGADNETDLDGDGTDDITGDSSISTNGGTTGLHIRNTGTSDLVIGTIDDLGYGLVSRGSVQVRGTSFGLGAEGIIFEGASDTARTIIDGGIHFDTGTLSVNVGDADATGMKIGNFATVNRFHNAGTVDVDTTISTTTDADDDTITIDGPGGDAVGVLVEENGIFNELINSGNILVSAQGEGSNSTGVLDRSGTLTNITNSGVILSQASDSENGSSVAIDVRANTTSFSLSNSGEINGDLLLGTGNDAITMDGGTLNGDIYFSSGNDRLTLSNDAEFIGSLAFDGTLDLFVNDADLSLGDTDTLHVSNAAFSGDANVVFTVDPKNQQAGSIVVDNLLSASSTVNITPVLESFASAEQSFNLITAQNINLADASASLNLIETPYLFQVALDQVDTDTGSTVTLNVRPKTADELDVSTSLKTLYSNIITPSLELDIALERSLAGLTTKDTVSDALASLLPDISNASFNSALVNKRHFDNQLANRLTDFTVAEKFEGGGWAREVTTYGDLKASQSQMNGDLLSVGLAMGYEVPISENLAVGVSTGFTLNGVNGVDPVDAQFSSFAPFVSVYGMARAGGFYVGVQGIGQYVDIERERTVNFASLDRLIESSTSGWNLTAAAEAGYELNLGGMVLKPFGRISAQSYSESGYIETGGDSANLDVSKRSFSRTEGTFGASLGYDFKWKRSTRNTSILRPEIFYSYTKALSGTDPKELDAIFVAGDTSFALEIDQMSETVKQFGGAFNIFSDGSTARIHYSHEKLDDLTAHAVSFNFALAF